jgi:hypothetical protein
MILRAIAILVGLAGLQHGVQAILGVWHGDDPSALVAEHVVVCLTGLSASYGLWRRTRWAVWMLAITGVATALLVASLGPLLKMDVAERGGLWAGSASILVMTAVAVWYTRRRVTAPVTA